MATIDWNWLAEVYEAGGWRIAGVRASGTRDQQELVLTLERQVPIGWAQLRLDVIPAEPDRLDDELAAWRGNDVG